MVNEAIKQWSHPMFYNQEVSSRSATYFRLSHHYFQSKDDISFNQSEIVIKVIKTRFLDSII